RRVLFRSTEADEGADGAEFVGRVVLPRALAVGALLELAPVAFERGEQRVLREGLLLAARRERDGGGRCVEVAELRRTWNEGDLLLRHRDFQRGVEIIAELVAR